MGEDRASWLPNQGIDSHPSNLNCFSTPFNLRQQNKISAYMNLCTNAFFKTEALPKEASHGAQALAGHANQPSPGWLYCLPQFRQSAVPTGNSLLNEKHCNMSFNSGKETPTVNMSPGLNQKRFLVFDQTGDQTTLIFSSGIGGSVHCPPSWTQKLPSARKWTGEEDKANHLDHSGPNLTDEFNDAHEVDIQSEMHEDTEELNALLYSDDETGSDYDEVSSTGHSPGAIISDDKQFWVDGIIEEVGSSDEPTKRQKVFHVNYDVPSPSGSDASRSAKQSSPKYEDDAESCCADGKSQCLEKNGSFSGRKRPRRDHIRETVSILQSIIPGGKGKDAILVLDEAINYLKSLKVKAEAMGLESF